MGEGWMEEIMEEGPGMKIERGKGYIECKQEETETEVKGLEQTNR